MLHEDIQGALGRPATQEEGSITEGDIVGIFGCCDDSVDDSDSVACWQRAVTLSVV